MTYKFSFTLEEPATGDTYDGEYTISFFHDPNQYGNGYTMLEKNDTPYKQAYDIRYDTRFDSSNVPAYIETFYKGKWNGDNGAWLLTHFAITQID